MDFSTEALDAATAELILQLQLDDFHELHERWKGKQRADEAPGDFCTALEIYHVDLERIKTTFSDERMSRSMEQATVDDGDLVSEFASEEAVAVEDRELAVRLEAEDAHGELASSSELHDDVCNSQTSLKLRRPLHNSNDDDERNSVQAGPSTRWTSSQANRSKPARCAICMEDIPSTKETTRAPCGKHDYCLDCLADLVTRSLTDDSLFPPRCCAQPIPIRDDDWTRSLLGPALVEAFLARQLEMSTSDRTYCHEPGCSAFIEPASITDDVGVCPLCQELTCAVCKGAAHDGDCPEDVGVQEVLFLAQENNWQRCSSCRRVVELRSGCHHITCLCGAEFCYVCAARWKMCACPQWQEERLFERAVAVVDRDVRARAALPERRAEEVRDVQRALRERHECRHLSWTRREGRHRCEECHEVLPLYLNVCDQCLIMVCFRCRLNRL